MYIKRLKIPPLANKETIFSVENRRKISQLMKTGTFLAGYEANKTLLSSIVEQQDKGLGKQQDKGLGTNLPVVYVPRYMTTIRCKSTERHRMGLSEAIFAQGRDFYSPTHREVG
jgi:hypothetical protein